MICFCRPFNWGLLFFLGRPSGCSLRSHHNLCLGGFWGFWAGHLGARFGRTTIFALGAFGASGLAFWVLASVAPQSLPWGLLGLLGWPSGCSLRSHHNLCLGGFWGFWAGHLGARFGRTTIFALGAFGASGAAIWVLASVAPQSLPWGASGRKFNNPGWMAGAMEI